MLLHDLERGVVKRHIVVLYGMTRYDRPLRELQYGVRTVVSHEFTDTAGRSEQYLPGNRRLLPIHIARFESSVDLADIICLLYVNIVVDSQQATMAYVAPCLSLLDFQLPRECKMHYHFFKHCSTTS